MPLDKVLSTSIAAGAVSAEAISTSANLVVGTVSVGNSTVNTFIHSTGITSNAFIANTTGVYHAGTINVSSYSIGSNLVANTTGVFHTGVINAASHTIGSSLVANTTGVYHTGVVNAASHTVGSNLVANATGVYHTGVVNAASHTIGSSLVANTTGVYHTGTLNAAIISTGVVVANATAVAPTSNTILLGNNTGRFVISANTGNFSGDVTVSTGIYLKRQGEFSSDNILFNGFPFKNLGHYTFRDGSRYFDAKLNITGDMQMFLVIGYLYNSGNIFSLHGSYSYVTSVINKFAINLGNSTISDVYRTSGGSNLLCIKLDRGSSSYSEGRVSIYYHTHDATQNSAEIISYAQNNSAGAHFTS
jgi:hypothetical protein